MSGTEKGTGWAKTKRHSGAKWACHSKTSHAPARGRRVGPPRRVRDVGLAPGHGLDVAGVDQHHLHNGQVLEQIVVKSGRGAVLIFRPVRFLGPLPAPAVRLSPQRALHKSRGPGVLLVMWSSRESGSLFPGIGTGLCLPPRD